MVTGRKRYNELDFDMHEKTKVEKVVVNNPVSPSPIGYYLFDMGDEVNYPLKDGWHYDLQVGEDIVNCFEVTFSDDEIKFSSEHQDNFFINGTVSSKFDGTITDDAIIEFKNENLSEKLVLSKIQNITIVEVKKIIGQYLVMSSNKAREKRLLALAGDREKLESELSEINSFFQEKIDLEKSILESPDEIEKIKAELEKKVQALVTKKVTLETKFTPGEMQRAQENLETTEKKLAEVNREIEKFSKR